MQTQICSWGNGNAIRLSKAIMESLNFNTKDILEVKIDNNRLILEKSVPHKTLEERVLESGKPLSSFGEYDFGEPKGGEYF